MIGRWLILLLDAGGVAYLTRSVLAPCVVPAAAALRVLLDDVFPAPDSAGPMPSHHPGDA